MRVNVYAEEITSRVELVSKQTANGVFTGVRFYLELPVTIPARNGEGVTMYRGPFQHHKGDDDSSAVTFWGKQDMRGVLRKALELLDQHYAAKEAISAEA